MNKKILVLLAVLVPVLLILFLVNQPIRAEGLWYVSPGGDDGNDCLTAATPCLTINGAIDKASSKDTVLVANGVYTSAIAPVAWLTIPLSLSGGWNSDFTSQLGYSTIDAQGRTGLEVGNRYPSEPRFVDRFKIYGAVDTTGLFANVFNRATLVLRDSIVDGGVGVGQGIRNTHILTISHSIVTNHSGAGINNYGDLHIQNSTISYNGGGIYNSGQLTVVNTTIANNEAESGGGIFNSWDGTVSLSNVTISGNRGGGIYQEGTNENISLRNAVVAANDDYAGLAPDCSGSFISLGYNLIGNVAGCELAPAAGDQVGVNPGLGQLIGGIGSIEYLPLMHGSLAIDSGDPSGCTDDAGNLLDSDQRGMARVGRCDIGAYEYAEPGQPAVVTGLRGSDQQTAPHSHFTVPLQAAVLDANGTPVNGIAVTMSAPASGPSGHFASSEAVTTTVSTDDHGLADAGLFVANALKGHYAVTVTANHVITPAHFILSNSGWLVALSGDNSNDCQSAESACASVEGVLTKEGFVADDTILISNETYTGHDQQPVLEFDRSARLLGGWNTEFTGQSGNTIIDGEGLRGGVKVDDGVTVVIENLTVQNGSAGVGEGYHSGRLVLRNSEVVNGGFAVARDSTAILEDSAVRSSSGTGFINSGILILKRSQVSGSLQYGGIYNNHKVVVLNSTISGNIGGAITNSERAVSAVLNNSTVSGNFAASSNPFGLGVIIIFKGRLSMNNSTVTDNSSDDGTLLIHEGTAVLRNSILGGNDGGPTPDCNGSIESLGFNIIGNSTDCEIIPATGDMIDTNPELLPLTGEPGFHFPSPTSPAIDGGDPTGCRDHAGALLLSDQRGAPRQGRCDIGSIERHPLDASRIQVSPATSVPGAAVTFSIVLDNTDDSDVPGATIVNALPDLLGYVQGSLGATIGDALVSGTDILWAGTVPANGEALITYKAVISESATLGHEIINSAEVKSGGRTFGIEARVTLDGPFCDVEKHDENPVLDVGDNGSWDEAGVWSPAVIKHDDRYLMWYTGYDEVGTSQIGLAASDDGIHWQKDPANPVLSPTDYTPGPWPAPWDSGNVAHAAVVFQGTRFHMWYTGYDENGVGQIGYATSPDGINWTKSGLNPVFRTGANGSWEDASVEQPTVLVDDYQYHLWYTGYDGMTARIGYASSNDGLNWTKTSENPVLDMGPAGDWDWLHAYSPSTVQIGGRHKLFYSGDTLPSATQIGYCTGKGSGPYLQRRRLFGVGQLGSFYQEGVGDISVLLDDGLYKAWYSAYDGQHRRIGHVIIHVCGPDGDGYQTFLPNLMRTSTSCVPYYVDTFDDSRSGWYVDANVDREYAYYQGTYRIQVKKLATAWGVTAGAKAKDFTLMVDARKAGGNGSYGVRFGINEDWSRFYDVLISDSHFSIWYYTHGYWSDVKGWTKSSAINTGQAWNHIEVTRVGSSIHLKINGVTVTNVIDDQLLGLGRIGLVASSTSKDTIDSRYDNFALYSVSCG